MPLFKKINKAQKGRIVLVAPLHWGLGHATRCIPLIRTFIELGCELIIAATGKQRSLLEQEFPGCRFANPPTYDIRYGGTAAKTFLRLMLQIPGILSSIRKENRWLNAFVEENKIDLVISDNRYGLFTKKAACVFITHQLLIKTGIGSWADNLLQQLNYSMINRFDLCWVPDFPEAENLAGELSHPQKLPAIPLRYIGPLSRFVSLQPVKQVNELLIILSGPEPSRTILEQELLSQLQSFNTKTMLVRGLPGEENSKLSAPPWVEVRNYATQVELQQIIAEAGIVLCRSGYSSVMDLLRLQKKCIFIPTPGQPEQQYLADYLQRKNYCIIFDQAHFSLPDAVEAATISVFDRFPETSETLYKIAVNETLEAL